MGHRMYGKPSRRALTCVDEFDSTFRCQRVLLEAEWYLLPFYALFTAFILAVFSLISYLAGHEEVRTF